MAGVLFNYPKFQAFDDDGNPLSGGLLYTYIAGMTTNKATYSNKNLTAPANANPIILNSRGEATVYCSSGSYKFILTVAGGDPLVPSDVIWSFDNWDSGNIAGSNFYFPDAGQADHGAATIAGDLTVKDFVDAIGTSKEATIVFARGSPGNNTDYAFLTSETIPSNIKLKFENGARLSVATGITVSIDSPDNIEANNRQAIFSLTGTGAISFSNSGQGSLMWFGAVSGADSSDALDAAIDSIATSKGTIFVPEGDFQIPSSSYSITALPGRIGFLGENFHTSILRFTTVASDGFDLDGDSDDTWFSNICLAAPLILQQTGYALHVIAGGTINCRGIKFKGTVKFVNWTEPIIKVDNGLSPYEWRLDVVSTENCSPDTLPYLIYWDANAGPDNWIGLFRARGVNTYSLTDTTAMYLYNANFKIDQINCYDGIRRAVNQWYGEIHVGMISFEPVEASLVDSVVNPPDSIYKRTGSGQTKVDILISKYAGTLQAGYELGINANNCWLGSFTHYTALGINHVNVGHVTQGANNYYHGLASEITYTAGSADVGYLKCFDDMMTPYSIQSVTITLTAAQVNALRATPQTLVAAGGAGTWIEFISAVIAYKYITTPFTVAADEDFVIEYENGTDVSASIETVGFIDQANNETRYSPTTFTTAVLTSLGNKGLRIFNTGAGETADGGTSTLTISILYKAHQYGT